MNRYEIKAVKSAELNFSRIKAVRVTEFPWNCTCRPETTAQIAALEDAFAVRMRTGDRNPRTEVLIMRGNFFKCAEKSEHPHYGCWAPVDLPRPDFHSPDYFGELILNI